jgi:hypothetical protein
MRCGLVGVFTEYRPTIFKGTKYGLIDVTFRGDLEFPTQTYEIKVHDPKLCSILIKTRAEIENPVLVMSCWIDLMQKEPYILLQHIVSIDGSGDFIHD